MVNYEKIVQLALEEDLGLGDITTDSLIPKDHHSSGVLRFKQDGVVCGVHIAEYIFHKINPDLEIAIQYQDGERVSKGTVIMEVDGQTASILKAERTALNFLQRLSGVATLANEFVEKVIPFDVRICDTRKTTPGFRQLEKYAVRCGGAFNHRMSLADTVLIKDNHIQAAGSISYAVEKARSNIPHTSKVEVEVESHEQVSEALSAKADIIMLDNMKVEQIIEAVKMINKQAIVEISGGVTIENVTSYANTGADVISIGALTHSYTSADISLTLFHRNFA